MHPVQSLIRDQRTIISFGAGIAIAYVFVGVMPDLHDARRAFAASTSEPLRYEGMAIYFLALFGFLVFYGLDHLRKRLRKLGDADSAAKSFKLNVGGFAIYVWLMAYQLVHNLKETPTSVALYAAAMTFHFWGVDHALHEEHGALYDRAGRLVLAGMCVAGWGAGLLFALPRGILALSVAFISGAIILNSTIMELPSEKDGRFLPLMTGGLLYGLMLLPLG